MPLLWRYMMPVDNSLMNYFDVGSLSPVESASMSPMRSPPGQYSNMTHRWFLVSYQL